MPDRKLCESIRTSESINRLTAFEETMFYRLIVSCDDEGCMDARPRIIRSTLYPLKDGVRDSQISNALQALSSAELVTLFEKNGKPFLRLTTWDKYQETALTDKPSGSVKKTPTAETAADRRFERFWAVYPRKVGKGAAKRSFLKYKPDDALTEKMISAVEAQKQTEQWKRDGGQYIPHPATWLNQMRWEDELMPEAPRQDTVYIPNPGLEDWN